MNKSQYIKELSNKITEYGAAVASQVLGGNEKSHLNFLDIMKYVQENYPEYKPLKPIEDCGCDEYGCICYTRR